MHKTSGLRTETRSFYKIPWEIVTALMRCKNVVACSLGPHIKFNIPCHLLSESVSCVCLPHAFVCLDVGASHRFSNCLGGAEEQFQVPSTRNPSPPARGLSPGCRDGVLCWLCLLACPGCVVCWSNVNAVQNRLRRVLSLRLGRTKSSFTSPA